MGTRHESYCAAQLASATGEAQLLQAAKQGLSEELERIKGNILIESPDRFARDLAVQLAGHDFLKKMGVTLIPATARPRLAIHLGVPNSEE